METGNKIAYIENGIAYFDEDRLSPCGCGGKAVAGFRVVDDKITDVSIRCLRCGIVTRTYEDPETAAKKWQKCFGELDNLHRKIDSGSLHENETLLSSSSHFDDGL